ncbi:MAG: hypothetical protein WC528_03700 [Patescibacteria group bacterium]
MPEKIIILSTKCSHCHQVIRAGEEHQCAGPSPTTKPLPPGTFYPCAQSGFVDTPKNNEEKP